MEKRKNEVYAQTENSAHVVQPNSFSERIIHIPYACLIQTDLLLFLSEIIVFSSYERYECGLAADAFH